MKTGKRKQRAQKTAAMNLMGRREFLIDNIRRTFACEKCGSIYTYRVRLNEVEEWWRCIQCRHEVRHKVDSRPLRDLGLQAKLLRRAERVGAVDAQPSADNYVERDGLIIHKNVADHLDEWSKGEK